MKTLILVRSKHPGKEPQNSRNESPGYPDPEETGQEFELLNSLSIFLDPIIFVLQGPPKLRYQFVLLSWGWVILEQTRILSGIQITRLSIEFVVVETNKVAGSNSNEFCANFFF